MGGVGSGGGTHVSKWFRVNLSLRMSIARAAIFSIFSSSMFICGVVLSVRSHHVETVGGMCAAMWAAARGV